MRKLITILFLFSVLCFLFSLAYARDIKQPDASGAFYPSNPSELKQQLEELLSNANPEEVEGDILALISPHAGYVYSGPVAAYGYKAVKGRPYDVVVILAQSHFHDFSGIAIWPKGEFATPLGSIKVDEELSAKLLSLNPLVKEVSYAFKQEHPIEVQLPFLQYALKDFKIIPLVMGSFSLSDCEVLAHSLKILLEVKNALIIASTDLSHYHPYEQAVSKDNTTISYIINNAPKALYDAALQDKAELCSLGPVLTALYYAQEKGLSLELLKYANSGDTSEDLSKVVGYVSIAFYKKNNTENSKSEVGMLNKEQRKRLLEIARGSIRTYLETNKKLQVSDKDPVLNKNMGAFVTLTENGQLRGCIGNLIGEQALYLTVRDMSIEAAAHDPRFSPVELSGLKDIEIEISVLSEMEKINDSNVIELGKHGVLIRKGYRSGVFLPQVATETGWTKDEFLSNLCTHKAGLPADCWRDGSSDIYIFTAEVFNEKEY